MSRLRIAHLSDPHFGTILPGVSDGLLSSLRDLKPDLILLTGDITQRARRSEFRAAKAFTRALKPIPLIAVPGNHDIPLFNLFMRLLNPYYGYRRLFKDQLEKDHVHGDVRVTGLNSTSRWRHVQGAFNLNRIDRRLGQASEKTKVHIVTFHHPMDCRRPQDEKNLLKNRDGAMGLFEKHGVDIILGGHIHDPYVTLSEIRYPKVKRNMIITVAGTATSWRTRADSPNSFHLIDVETESVPRVTITRYDRREDCRYYEKNSHRFHRPDDLGWVVVD